MTIGGGFLDERGAFLSKGESLQINPPSSRSRSLTALPCQTTRILVSENAYLVSENMVTGH